MTKEIELLQEASNEIKDLRARNERQSIRLVVIDDMLDLLRAKPTAATQGYSEDVAWKIDKYIRENQQESEI